MSTKYLIKEAAGPNFHQLVADYTLPSSRSRFINLKQTLYSSCFNYAQTLVARPDPSVIRLYQAFPA